MSNKNKFVEVECCNCFKKFNKTIHRYKESIKKKYRFFCGKECISAFFTTKIKCNCSECLCDIEVQKGQLERSKNKRFFCSSTCSARFNNKLRGAKGEKEKQKISKSLIKHYAKKGTARALLDKVCPICDKRFKTKIKNRICCSKDCGNIYQFGSLPYTKDEVVTIVLNIVKDSGRTPQKRDCLHKLYHAAVKFFGTWNKAMVECGLKPNHSKYQKIRLKCKDGHIVDSISEKIIDEWFFKNNIAHEKNKKYPNSNMDCDFYLSDYDLWVEYFGLWGGGIKEYDKTIEDKEKIIVANDFNFVGLKPLDLYVDNGVSYEKKLQGMFRKYFNV
jgi:hypothetical protein